MMHMPICYYYFLNSIILGDRREAHLLSLWSHLSKENVIQLWHQWWNYVLIIAYMYPSRIPLLSHKDHLYLVPTLTASFWVSALILTILIHCWCYLIKLSISHRYKELKMDRNHSSVNHTGSCMKYIMPNFTQLDAWQWCPALIVLKEENNNNKAIPLKIICTVRNAYDKMKFAVRIERLIWAVVKHADI